MALEQSTSVSNISMASGFENDSLYPGVVEGSHQKLNLCFNHSTQELLSSR